MRNEQSSWAIRKGATGSCSNNENGSLHDRSIAGGLAHILAIEGNVQVHGCFGSSEEQKTVRSQSFMGLCEDLSFGFWGKIDEHISKKDDIHRLKSGPWFDQVQFAELDHLAKIFLDSPLHALLIEVLQQQWQRQAAVDFGLVVNAFFARERICLERSLPNNLTRQEDNSGKFSRMIMAIV